MDRALNELLVADGGMSADDARECAALAQYSG